MLSALQPAGSIQWQDGSSTLPAEGESTLERAGPWVSSLLMHLGLILVGIFALFAAYAAHPAESEALPMAFPESLNPGNNLPAGGTLNPDKRPVAQDQLEKRLKTDGTALTESPANAASLLDGRTAEIDASLIAPGTGGSIGQGPDGVGQGSGGVLAPYGARGRGDFFGVKPGIGGPGTGDGHGRRIVYILDHSGSMLDNFDFLRQEAIRSVDGLIPVQKFSVVMVSEVAVAIYPGLQSATPATQRDFATKLGTFQAKGQNDDLLDPFQQAFEKAFAMKPDTIYFLTDGHFDPRLMQVVAKLNPGSKVQVNTFAFINKEASYEDQLKEMAKSNAGVYKFVSEKDLQK